MSEKSGGRQFGGTFEKLFSDKRARIVVAIILTVLASAALYFGFAGNKTNSSAEGETTLYVRELEERLSAILSKVEGAGKVSVAVNAASGKQTVLAMKKTEKITDSGTEREETPLIVNGKTVVLKELKLYGDISVQRMYGDFSNPVMSEWSKKGLEYAIVPIHQARYTASKNASDIMLVIDAMDILFQGSADIFCIVSSDSDFTRLASRLREGGRKVIGMGKSDASKSFITACNEYKFLDKISEEENDSFEADSGMESSAVTPLGEIKNAINYMIQQAESRGEMLELGAAKSQLQREFADFDERNYGYSLFRKFIEEDTKFVVGKVGSRAYITRRNQDKKQDGTDSIENFIIERAKSRAELASLGKELHDKYPNFKYKDLGYSKLSKYIQSIAKVKITNKGNKQFVEQR